MAKTHTYTIGSREFTGKTMNEAKRNAEYAIDAAFSGSYEPRIIFWRNHTLVISRSVDGWGYRIIWPHDREEGKLIGAWCNQDGMGIAEAEAHGTFHLAQAAWKPEDGVGAPAFLNVVAKRQELESWQRWQLRYLHFRSLGHGDAVCHTLASDSRQKTPFDEQ